MPTAHFEIRVADFNDEYFTLSVIDAPELSPELAHKSFPISKKTLARPGSPRPGVGCQQQG